MVMYTFFYYAIALFVAVVLFIIFNVALGFKMGIVLLWFVGWLLLWALIGTWWLMVAGFKLMRWLCGMIYEIFGAIVLWLLNRRTAEEEQNNSNGNDNKRPITVVTKQDVVIRRKKDNSNTSKVHSSAPHSDERRQSHLNQVSPIRYYNPTGFI
jgi:hypothetical protein